MTGQLDRLALISKLLLEPRILELRNENERLKLELFWKNHSKSQLQDLMQVCNQECKCLSCAVSGRMEEGPVSVPLGAPCKFKAWFDQQLAMHGLTTIQGVQLGQDPVGPHMSCNDGDSVYDVDAHFHHITRDDWFIWMYGSKLWKAKTVNDPELMKLQALFRSLSDHAEMD